MGVLDLFEREDGIDHWLNCFLGQQRHNFSCECAGDCDLLLKRSRTKHRADDVKTFAEDLIEVDICLTTRHSADENEPATQRHCFETGSEIRSSIQIEYDIKSVAGYIPGKSSKTR